LTFNILPLQKIVPMHKQILYNRVGIPNLFGISSQKKDIM
jgi:hypothetical protein